MVSFHADPQRGQGVHPSASGEICPRFAAQLGQIPALRSVRTSGVLAMASRPVTIRQKIAE